MRERENGDASKCERVKEREREREREREMEKPFAREDSALF